MRQNDSRKLKLEALNERRRQVVECRKRGMSQQEVSALMGMSTVTIGKIDRLFREGGLKAVEVVKDGRPAGKGRILESEQEREAQRLIMDRTPDQLKLPYALWNRQAVREMIRRRYDRDLSVRSVGNYLKRWGYTPQKPLHKAYEQRAEEVRKWHEERFPGLKARAVQEGADILWGKVPNYKQAFQEDTEIGQVVSKIGALMVDRGYPLKDAEQELKSIETQQAEDAMTQSSASAASLAESPLDMLKKRAKADIILQIWWKVNKTETGRAVSFTLEAFDAYTSKRIAASTGTSDASPSVAVPMLLESAVVSAHRSFHAPVAGSFR